MRHECSKTAWARRPNELGGISAYSAVAAVVIKVITGNGAQCSRGVSGASVIWDDKRHQRREGRKSREDTQRQQMSLFTLYHSNKASYIGKHRKYIHSSRLCAPQETRCSLCKAEGECKKMKNAPTENKIMELF